jgi:hypothetical protein
MTWNCSLSPRRTLSTKVLSWTGSPRSARASAVDEALHLAAVVVDGEGALGERTELSVDEHGVRRAVVEELFLKTEPGDPGGDAIAVMDDIEQVGGDGVVEPKHHYAIHPRPGRVRYAGRIVEDMVLQGEAAEDEENVAAPLGEVGGLKIQSNRNEISDILDGGGLAVELDDGGVIRGEGVDVVVREVVAVGLVLAGGSWAVAHAKGGGALLQGERLSALGFEGVGGGADALQGGGLEESGVILQLLTALGISGAQGSVFLFQKLGGGEGLITMLGRARSPGAGEGGAAGAERRRKPGGGGRLASS